MTRLIHPNESTVAHLDSADWVILLVGIVIFVAIALISTDENALAVAVTWGVLAEVVVQRWRIGKDPCIWVLAVVAVIQLPVVFLIHIPRLSTGLVCIPFMLIEAFALWSLLKWTDRHFPRSEQSRRQEDVQGRDRAAVENGAMS